MKTLGPPIDVNSGLACHQGTGELCGTRKFSQFLQCLRKNTGRIVAPSESWTIRTVARGHSYTQIFHNVMVVLLLRCPRISIYHSKTTERHLNVKLLLDKLCIIAFYTWFKSADNLFYTAGTVTATAQIIHYIF